MAFKVFKEHFSIFYSIRIRVSFVLDPDQNYFNLDPQHCEYEINNFI